MRRREGADQRESEESESEKVKKGKGENHLEVMKRVLLLQLLLLPAAFASFSNQGAGILSILGRYTCS